MPGNDELAGKVCRERNLAGADAKTRFPDRFGFWASLPLPDVQGSLEELAYAFDELKADGVAVETNVHGYYLGHPKFESVWAELDRRHAIVFVHPTSGCTMQQTTACPLPEYPNPIFEFFFDTARAVINLFYSGTVSRYSNITYIIPHAGGCLPPLIERFSISGRAIPNIPVDSSVNPDFVKSKLKTNFYFDMAGTPWPYQMPALLAFVDKDHILYGSDYPFTPAEYVERLADVMEKFMPQIFSTEEQQAMAYKVNAERLFRDQAAGVDMTSKSEDSLRK